MDKVDRKYFWKDKKWLKEKYSDEGKSCAQCAVLAECDPKTVYSWLLKFKIHIRTRQEAIELKYGKRGKQVSYEEELRTKLNRIAALEAEDRELIDRYRFDTHQMSLDERIDYLKRQEELKEQKRIEEDEKRKRLYAEDQIRLKAAIKKQSIRLEGTAKEEILVWQRLCDDLSGYRK